MGNVLKKAEKSKIEAFEAKIGNTLSTGKGKLARESAADLHDMLKIIAYILNGELRQARKAYFDLDTYVRELASVLVPILYKE